MTSAMDTPFMSVFNVNSDGSLVIVPVARPKPVHMRAAVMPRASLSQYMVSRGFMMFQPLQLIF